MQFVFHLEQPLGFLLRHAGDRNAGPHTHHFGDVIVCYDGALLALALLPLSSELVQILAVPEFAVAEFGGGFVALLGDGGVLFAADVFQRLHRFGHRGGRYAAAQPDTRAGFVNQVNGLVGQEAVGYEAGGEGGGAANGVISEVHIMVFFVAFLDAHQDFHGFVAGWLLHPDRLKPALQGGIALHILAIVVQRGSPDALQFAAGQGWLQDVGGVHRALRGAGAYQRMDFVNEQHAVAGAFDFLDDFLQPFLKFAAVLGAGDQGTHIQGNQTLVLKGVGNFAFGDHLGHRLDNGGFADARLAHQHRVVLGAAGKDLDDALEFLIAAHYRVQFVGAGGVGQVNAEVVQRGGFGVGAG